MQPAVKQLHQPAGSNVPLMMFNLACVAVGVYALAAGWPTTHPAWIAAATLWLAYFQYCWTTIFHEDVHYTLYRARWHNIFNGTIVGTLLLVPFSVYRQVHVRHHAKMNSPDDWELWPYTDPSRSLRFRRVFLWFDLLLGTWVAPWIYGRMFWVRSSPLKDPKLRQRIALEYLLIAAFWGTLLALVAHYGWWRPFLLAYVVPAWLAGMLQTLRKFVDHLGLPAGEAMAGCRTVLSRSWIGKLIDLTSFNINAHGLHHKFPQMPHANLARARDLVTSAAGAPIFRSHLAAVRDTLPHFAFPGIGLNARPPAPAAAPVEVAS